MFQFFTQTQKKREQQQAGTEIILKIYSLSNSFGREWENLEIIKYSIPFQLD